MAKINCNVIQDILPLYIEDVVSNDTKELVEEHLQNCEICQRVYHETKTDFENDMKISAQTKEGSNEANDLKRFRKFLKKRKIKTILFSIAATVICFVAVFIFMNKHVTYISYKDAAGKDQEATEKADEKAFDEEQAIELESKMRKNEFTLDDYLSVMKKIRKMGSFKQILGMMPGIPSEIRNAEIDEKQLL